MYAEAVEAIMQQTPGGDNPPACVRCGQVKDGMEAVYKPGTSGADGAMHADMMCQECLDATRRDKEIVDQDDTPVGDTTP